MKVIELKNEGLKREFKITINAGDLITKLENKALEIAKTIKIPGFRLGKVPVSMVKQKHSEAIRGEVIENTVKETTMELMRERNMSPALQPRVELGAFAEGADFVYSISFEIYPEVPEINFSTIIVNRPNIIVEDTDINDGLLRLQKAQKQFKTLDERRAAKNGDVVIIDFVGSIDGEDFEDGSSKDYMLELGSDNFIPGFEQQLEGAFKGDKKEVKVAFPENYGNMELAGKDAVFSVTVHDIQEVEIPEANEELAKKFGFESIDKLKEEIGKRLVEDFADIAKTKLKKELFDRLDQECNFDVPEGMLELEYKNILEGNKEHNKDETGETTDNLEYKNLARRRVKLGILLANIGKERAITVTPDELRGAVFAKARLFPGHESRIIELYQGNSNLLNQLHGPIMEEKIVDFILSKISLTDKDIFLKELIAFNEEE